MPGDKQEDPGQELRTAAITRLGLTHGLWDSSARQRWLGSGTDHAAVAVDGFVVRFRAPGSDALDLDKEAELLQLLAPRLDVEVPVPLVVDHELGASIHQYIAGRTLLGTRTLRRDVYLQLRAVIGQLSGIPPQEVRELVPVDEYAMTSYASDAAEDLQTASDALTAGQRRLAQRFVESEPPENASPGPVRFCHHDLGAEHLLVDEEGRRLVGILDWSDATLADPAHDVGLIRRDFGAATARAVAGVLLDADPGLYARAVFLSRCKLLEDLAYGMTDPNGHAHAAAARRAFDEVFADSPRS